MNENDKRFKPGFFRQYIEFKKFINSPKSEVNLATMLDDRKAFEIMNQILGSVEK
jgi:hypothetical protein